MHKRPTIVGLCFLTRLARGTSCISFRSRRARIVATTFGSSRLTVFTTSSPPVLAGVGVCAVAAA